MAPIPQSGTQRITIKPLSRENATSERPPTKRARVEKGRNGSAAATKKPLTKRQVKDTHDNQQTVVATVTNVATVFVWDDMALGMSSLF